MTFRDYARDAADTAISLARVTASRILSRAKSLALDVIVSEDDDESGETMEGAEVYGEAALLFRPADPTTAGAPEVIVWRHGDERIVIATKDRRWQVELEKGDVCLRAFAEDAPKLYLRADGTAEVVGGTVIVSSDDIRLGGAGPLGAMALASPVDSRNDAVAAALDAFCATAPVPNDGGAAIQTAVKAVWGLGTPPTPPSDVGATKVTGE